MTGRILIKEAVRSNIRVHQPATVGGVLYGDSHGGRHLQSCTCLNPCSNHLRPWQLPAMFAPLSSLRSLFPRSSAPAETSSSLQTSPQTSTREVQSSLQDRKFSVKMLLGRCQIANNDYRCTCKNGKFVSETAVLDKTALCDDCIHPMHLHDQFSGGSHCLLGPSNDCSYGVLTIATRRIARRSGPLPSPSLL